MDSKETRESMRNDEGGVSSIEYALIGSLIAVVCVIVLIAVGGNLEALYMDVCRQVSTASSGDPC